MCSMGKPNCFNRPRDHWTLKLHPCFSSPSMWCPISMRCPKFYQINIKFIPNVNPIQSHINFNQAGWWFQPTPLKNMSSSVGMMTFPTEWKVIKFMFQTTSKCEPHTIGFSPSCPIKMPAFGKSSCEVMREKPAAIGSVNRSTDLLNVVS